jgi:hypothetical protein
VYPSSQMYSSLNFVIAVSHELLTRSVEEIPDMCPAPNNPRRPQWLEF